MFLRCSVCFLWRGFVCAAFVFASILTDVICIGYYYELWAAGKFTEIIQVATTCVWNVLAQINTLISVNGILALKRKYLYLHPHNQNLRQQRSIPKAYVTMCFRIHACVRVILFLAPFFRLLTMANKRTMKVWKLFLWELLGFKLKLGQLQILEQREVNRKISFSKTLLSPL